MYSLVEHPEFGGSFRTSPAHLSGAPINLTSPENISKEIQELYIESVMLTKKGLSISQGAKPEEILAYIDECIRLNCKIIKIHPFADGNGRSARALLNLYFKMAGIPPVYVKASEREEYQEAMSKAICDEEYNPDFSSINRFYYYKLCDSIVILDIENTKENNKSKNCSVENVNATLKG